MTFGRAPPFLCEKSFRLGPRSAKDVAVGGDVTALGGFRAVFDSAGGAGVGSGPSFAAPGALTDPFGRRECSVDASGARGPA